MGSFLRHTWDLIVKGAMLAGGFLRGMFAGDNKAIVLLLALMIADYLSGLVSAFLKRSRKSVTGGLSSAAGARGLLKKGLMLLVVLLAYALDDFIGQGNAMFQSAVTWFYISNEALSLLENLALAGVPIPRRLRSALERLSQEEQEDAAGELNLGPQVDMAGEVYGEEVPPEEDGPVEEQEEPTPQPPGQPGGASRGKRKNRGHWRSKENG